MKRILGLATLSVSAVTVPSAMAQSSVTLYGLADAGVNYVSGQEGAKTRLSSGIMEGSKWGLKGNEDLGGGWRAVFTIEGRIELDNGSNSNRPASGSQLPERFGFTAAQFGVPAPFQPGVDTLLGGINANVGSQIGVNLQNRPFDRQAFVGLVTPVGAVLMGRQYTPAYELFYLYDAMETQTSLSAAQIATLPPAIDIRRDNTIAYRAQARGITGTLAYSFGEQPESSKHGRYMAANLYYTASSWGAGVAYAHNTNTAGDTALRNLVAGGFANVGPGKLSLLFGTAKDENPESVIPIRAALAANLVGPAAVFVAPIGDAYAAAFRQDARLYHVGYRLGSGPHQVTVSYNRFNDRERDNADVSSYGAVYTYMFSKRTDINFVLTRFDNDDNAQAAPGGNGFFGGVTSRAGRDAHNVALALRHRF